MANELNRELRGARIKKIIQPQKEEMLFTVNREKETKRLFISANASLPLIYLTDENRLAPASAPNFCMVLRKHIGSGIISDVVQIQNERVIKITVDHLDELGDPAKKFLYVEIMGKHSNLIFTDANDKIIDSIKHISALQSSVREVLPGREYFIPFQEGKLDPYMDSREDFSEAIRTQNTTLTGFLCGRYMGIAKLSATEIAYRAGLDADASTGILSGLDADAVLPPVTLAEAGSNAPTVSEMPVASGAARLYTALQEVLYAVALEREDSEIIMVDGVPKEYAPFHLHIYEDAESETYASVSKLLFAYYSERNKATNNKQRSGDVKKLMLTLIDRTKKKLALQEKQLSDTAKMDSYMLYGNLLTAYPYQVPAGVLSVELEDYNTGKPVKIPLDKDLSAIENATRYFDKYNKMKRTRDAVDEQIVTSREQLAHLESILANLEICDSDADLEMIRKELFEYGFVKKNPAGKKKRVEKSRPLHFVTADGFHIYVGKNNYQNDELTFKLATGNDWWFHAKQIPGSHVIVRTEGRKLPDDVFEIAAALAGYYSSGRSAEKLEIDYVEKKNIKRTPHTPPGFVIYYTNYSMTIHPALPEGVTAIE
ncbi:MAG: NFACT family protein [Lachnospiraceae bacterium]|nr:NFACT family protein [Lachnospiraceae bacterium]